MVFVYCSFEIFLRLFSFRLNLRFTCSTFILYRLIGGDGPGRRRPAAPGAHAPRPLHHLVQRFAPLPPRGAAVRRSNFLQWMAVVKLSDQLVVYGVDKDPEQGAARVGLLAPSVCP